MRKIIQKLIIINNIIGIIAVCCMWFIGENKDTEDYVIAGILSAVFITSFIVLLKVWKLSTKR